MMLSFRLTRVLIFLEQTLVEAVGDWYFGRSPSQAVREIGCEYPCNPICNSLQLPAQFTTDLYYGKEKRDRLVV